MLLLRHEHFDLLEELFADSVGLEDNFDGGLAIGGYFPTWRDICDGLRWVGVGDARPDALENILNFEIAYVFNRQGFLGELFQEDTPEIDQSVLGGDVDVRTNPNSFQDAADCIFLSVKSEAFLEFLAFGGLEFHNGLENSIFLNCYF